MPPANSASAMANITDVIKETLLAGFQKAHQAAHDKQADIDPEDDSSHTSRPAYWRPPRKDRKKSQPAPRARGTHSPYLLVRPAHQPDLRPD